MREVALQRDNVGSWRDTTCSQLLISEIQTIVDHHGMTGDISRCNDIKSWLSIVTLGRFYV